MARTPRVEPSILGLKRVRLLEGLADETLGSLVRQCRWRRFGAGERIISREAVDNDVYLIVSGRVRITAFSAGGRQVTYADMPAGHWFGDFAAIDGQSRSADVVALEETVLASLTPASALIWMAYCLQIASAEARSRLSRSAAHPPDATIATASAPPITTARLFIVTTPLGSRHLR